ncbi:hypothetical protein [Nostoc sp. MS1]|uniref:hypothetical protein n=1 Tax=Nostoc sp. MS1 TaxID=2764711 RepID=UPI001CC820CC|nr:hypothetical protein [Nostoc sp. MS1]
MVSAIDFSRRSPSCRAVTPSHLTLIKTINPVLFNGKYLFEIENCFIARLSLSRRKTLVNNVLVKGSVSLSSRNTYSCGRDRPNQFADEEAV